MVAGGNFTKHRKRLLILVERLKDNFKCEYPESCFEKTINLTRYQILKGEFYGVEQKSREYVRMGHTHLVSYHRLQTSMQVLLRPDV